MESFEFGVLEVPARVANLAFRMTAPREWKLHELPGEDVDISVPTAFFPLVVLTAPWAAVALTVVARPGFEDGSLQDWALFLLGAQNIRPTSFGPAQIGNVPGVVGVGHQEQEGTLLEVRFAFFEDGGRLVHLGLLAPEAISATFEQVWRNAVEGFELNSPQGPTVPVGSGMGVMPERATEPEPAAPVEEAAAPVSAADAPDPSPVDEPKRWTEEDLGYYAKSDDASTLDPEHPINARLRDQGVGFVPNVLEMDLAGKTARLGAGAIQAMIRVALGWHVNDDGRRTLLLDPDGKIQISLHLLMTEGRSVDQMLDDLEEETARSYPHPEMLRVQKDAYWALLVRNIAVNEEPIEQIHLLTAWRSDRAMLRARVTCDPAQMRYAVDYADLILRSVDYGDGPRG